LDNDYERAHCWMCVQHCYVRVYRVTVLDKSYSGLGTTKTDAKTNAAANALEELRANGAYAVRQRKLNSQRRGLLDWQMMASQLSDSKFHG